MEAMYPYFLTVHLLCAIIFLGFIFTDVVLLTPIRKNLGDDIADKVWGVISRRGKKIMPLCLLLLVITGGAMVSRYIGSEIGFFETTTQQLLILKVFFALLIVLMVIISLALHFLKKPNPLGNIIHPIALILGFGIVILAKMAFYW